jgi:hypothetical protein
VDGKIAEVTPRRAWAATQVEIGSGGDARRIPGSKERIKIGCSTGPPTFGGAARDDAPEQGWHLPKATWLTYIQD